MLSLVLCLAIAQVAQPPRDAPPPREATGSIGGIVTGADTGLPLRRALVSLVGGPPPPRAAEGPVRMTNRTVATDLEGRFEFTGLGPGSYRVRVMPGNFRGQYVAGWYGGGTAAGGGKPIDLKAGERRDGANVALLRGGAINGRVVDEFGEPIARAQVYPARVMGGGSDFRRTGPGSQTDDLGRFRIYGLEPGEYIVAAESRNMGGPPAEGETEGFATTFYPSASSERDAGRIPMTAAGEAGEIQIQLVRTRTFRITGMVMDSRGNQVMRPNVMLGRAAVASQMSFSGAGMSFDQNGTFTIRDVTPGDYRLFVRPGGGPPPPPGAQAQGAPKPEYAVVPISVSSDIEDLVVVTKPGVSVIGEVVFAEGPPATLPSGLRIVGTPAERTMMMGPQPSGVVGANLQFTLNDAFGPLFVRVAAGLPRGYAVKEVRLGSTDISDTPVEFKAEDSKRLQVVLTSRVATLEGTVTDDDGAPVDDALVLIIPEEKSSWRMGSPRLRTLSGFKEGKYSSPAVLPGRYFVVAVPRERFSPGIDPRPDYFEPFTRDATAVVLNDGETRTVDLRVARPADR